MKNRPSGLMAKCGLLLLAAGAASMILFSVLYSCGRLLLDDYLSESDFQAEQIEKHVISLQKYIDKNALSSQNTRELTAWVKQQPMILLEIYRQNILVYTSAAPNGIQSWDEQIEQPSYDWVADYPVAFSDGEATVVIYANDTLQWYFYLTLVSATLAVLLFFFVFLWNYRDVVQYICCLSRQIQAMEGGDLDVQITIQGDHELSRLAESLESMRRAFKEQREQETKLYKAHQTMITSMSHDLRTPLTTLQIYTDILRYKKYEPAQLDSYLERIDAKASQIKQLAENIFEYSLVSRQNQVKLEALPVRQVFHDLISEYVEQWSRQGFSFTFSMHWPDISIAVYPPYIKRLLDNISSNLLKYADKHSPVGIGVESFQEGVKLTVTNVIQEEKPAEESTHIGLSNVETMMRKMNGYCEINQTETQFAISLIFPCVESSTEMLLIRDEESVDDYEASH